MFPIRDHNPSERTPYVRNGLIFLNVLMFLLTDPWLGNMVALWGRLALYPLAITQGEWLWGLVTHMFLHAGFMHIIGNMLFLWVFGDNLEDQMGHVGFLVFYLACGLLAAGGQIMADPQSTIPMIGASGAIAGVLGGYLLLFPRARVDVIAIIIIIFKRFTIPAWVLLMAWFALLAQSGSDVAGLRAMSARPEFAQFVLDFLLEQDQRVLDFAASAGIRPERVQMARAVLGGGDPW